MDHLLSKEKECITWLSLEGVVVLFSFEGSEDFSADRSLKTEQHEDITERS